MIDRTGFIADMVHRGYSKKTIIKNTKQIITLIKEERSKKLDNADKLDSLEVVTCTDFLFRLETYLYNELNKLSLIDS